MNKQYFILSSPSGNAGVAKIIRNGNKAQLSLRIEKQFASRKNCYVICDDEKIKAGVTGRGTINFELPPEKDIIGVFLTDGDPEKIIAGSGDINDTLSDLKKNETDTIPPVTPDFFTFENFFGGGFDWHRIRGNFIMFDYSIIHHVLSGKNIYPAINKSGYYCAGIKRQDDLTLIAIAFPVVKGVENPFLGINADTYTIYQGNKEFTAICVGIDKTGEFFLSI